MSILLNKKKTTSPQPKEVKEQPKENEEILNLKSKIAKLEQKLKEKPKIEPITFSDNFWLVWEDFAQSVDSVFRPEKWKAKAVEWSVIKSEILKYKK